MRPGLTAVYGYESEGIFGMNIAQVICALNHSNVILVPMSDSFLLRSREVGFISLLVESYLHCVSSEY